MKYIDPFLLHKIHSQTQTAGNNADPKMRVSIARARSTVVDSTYWTTEMIRQGSGLGDIGVSARRRKVKGSPDKLFEIHVKDDVVSTSTRKYPDRFKDGWCDEFRLGDGSSVAIAFDGDWYLHRNVWRLVTEEHPYISWVSATGILQCQYWSEENSRVILSDEVKFVRMIRGWKSLDMADRDQGIIVAYIKSDGGVYYRNLCNREDGVKVWEPERRLTLFEGSAKTMNLFITTDYRVGFVVEDLDSKISWYITTRNWVGMASPAENIKTGITDVSVNVIPVAYYESKGEEHITSGIVDIDLQICPAELDFTDLVIKGTRFSQNEFLIEFKYSILNVVDSLDFSVDSFNVQSIRYGQNDKEIILTVDRAISEIGVFTIRYSGSSIRAELSEVCKAVLPSFDVIVTGKPPEIVEKIQAGIQDINLRVSKVHYLILNHEEENIKAGIEEVNIVVTKVGNNPL